MPGEYVCSPHTYIHTYVKKVGFFLMHMDVPFSCINFSDIIFQIIFQKQLMFLTLIFP